MLLADKVIGHAKQIESLLKDYTTGNLAHAYLFHGPSQAGKFTLAQNFANLLQCEHDFCGICSTCKQFASGQHLDTVIWPDQGEGDLGVEAVRELIAHLSQTSQSPYKLCLIENVERFTTEASNALLKLLEEPSADTIFFLTSSSLLKLLPTIISRCRLLRFSLLDDAVIKKELAKLDLSLSSKNIEALHFGSGRPGRVITYLRHPENLESMKLNYQELADLISKQDLVERFQYIAELTKQPERIATFLDQFLAFSQKQLEELDLTQDQARLEMIMQRIYRIEKTRHYLSQSVNPRLALENLLLQV